MKRLPRRIRFLAAFFVVLLGVFWGVVNAKLGSVKFESSRHEPLSHLLIVGLDARPGGDKGLPDTLMLLDLGTGEFEQIPRNWQFSLLDPDAHLVTKYLGIEACEPFCSIQAVYAFSKLGLEPPITEDKSLDTLARIVESEYRLPSVAVLAFDLTWAYSFFARVAPVTFELGEAVPVGGSMIDDGYSGVKRMIEPGLRQFYGGDLYWIARARFGTSNEDRMRRQTELVEAIRHQKNLVEIISAGWGAQGFFATDLQITELLRLATVTNPSN